MIYRSTADELVRRIEALIPAHPEILRFKSPWDLFTVEGFACTDLGPSMAQASWALGKAKANAQASTAERRET